MPPPSPASSYMLAVQSLDPRPLGELHNEHAYLLYDLQKQGDRATRLFQRYAAVEARLAEAQTSSETKKCKKEACLVRTKIAENTQQRQLILLRLGEIHVELQNRDRWMLVHHQPLLQPPAGGPLVYHFPTPSPSLGSAAEACCLSPCHEEQEQEQEEDTPATELSSDYFSCGSPSVLSPLSPSFTPGVVFFAEDIWSRAASKTTSSAEKETEDDERSAAPADPIGETDEAPSQQGRTGGVERDVGHRESEASRLEVDEGTVSPRDDDYDSELPRENGHERRVADGADAEQSRECGSDEDEDVGLEEDTQAWRDKLRRISLYFPPSAKARDKRMSLPYVKNMWSRQRRNSL
ncbi:hypothetical protein C8A00DRAFT_11151 [Chaetomidium leptoderma]|uniref:Uncharacterized protein n=1 Tax=Chaetomidium leptoderma TaxID=669021 RepID=A0AAN6VVM5_9PEZI|nr:hypothetical protein C8A00DRAFT_11151 [Chaetomidium leptoderma]